MSFAQPACLSTGSTLRPMTLALRFLKSGLSLATAPSSVVHTGVKSFGCENRMPQESPSHSWNLISPCVVLAVKSGAISPMRRDMEVLLGILELGIRERRGIILRVEMM